MLLELIPKYWEYRRDVRFGNYFQRNINKTQNKQGNVG